MAYYTLITSVILFFWSIFMAPKPQGFILTLLILPIALFFLLPIIKISQDEEVDHPSENKNRRQTPKLTLAILATLFISSFSLFVYTSVNAYILSPEAVSPTMVFDKINSVDKKIDDLNKTTQSYYQMSDELETIRKEIAKAQLEKKTSNSQVLGDLTTQVGTVTITNKSNQTISVYEKKDISSKIIGKAEFGKNYTFLEKDKDWYLIILADSSNGQSAETTSIGGQEGYVNSQFMKEVSY